MATKLDKNTLPVGHTREDFEGFGPVVVRDTEWNDARLCDLGCFNEGTPLGTEGEPTVPA